MPNYDFYCPVCETTEERNVEMSEREEQDCERCYHRLDRKWTFNGSVWAPTATGGGAKV
jgi:putative FmdB family regulatory protein